MKPTSRFSCRSRTKSIGKVVSKMTKSLAYVGVLALVAGLLLTTCVGSAWSMSSLGDEHLASIRGSVCTDLECRAASPPADCTAVSCHWRMGDDSPCPSVPYEKWWRRIFDHYEQLYSDPGNNDEAAYEWCAHWYYYDSQYACLYRINETWGCGVAKWQCEVK